MKLRTSTGMVVCALVAACSGPAKTAPPPAERTEPARAERPEYKAANDKTPAAPATPAPAPPAAKLTPVGERAQVLREAADLLDKAQTALDNGNRNLADQLFSTAELLTGPEAVAPVAPRFREGAPPRITTPTQKVDPSASPQPRVVGSSEAEDERDRVPPPRVEGSLSGALQVDGRSVTGAYGLITLEPESGKWKPRTSKRLVVEQRNREFLPHVMAIS